MKNGEVKYGKVHKGNVVEIGERIAYLNSWDNLVFARVFGISEKIGRPACLFLETEPKKDNIQVDATKCFKIQVF